jgi:hypothetical protein
MWVGRTWPRRLLEFGRAELRLCRLCSSLCRQHSKAKCDQALVVLQVANRRNHRSFFTRSTPRRSTKSTTFTSRRDHAACGPGLSVRSHVRVGNKGSDPAGSGPITVRAFHADPGIGLTWPEDWVPLLAAKYGIQLRLLQLVQWITRARPVYYEVSAA